MVWKECCGTGPRPTGTGSWTTGGKPTSSPWPAARRRKGHGHWTLRLLAGKVVELGLAPSMSREGVRKRLKKNALKPWQKKEWCIPKVSAEFVANMEDVLDLYAEPYDPRRPVVCFDETSTQLLAETREPLPTPAGISA